MSEIDLSRPITLHFPKRIEVGSGTAATVGDWAEDLSPVLVITSNSTAAMVDRLKITGTVEIISGIPAEPKDTDLAKAVEAARRIRPALIVGLGGGSVMDVAKLTCGLWDSDQTLEDVAGPNRVRKKCSALAQVATTAGTGSEGGIRGLVTSSDTGMKIAVESPHLLADLAVLDPDLTMSVPGPLTAATGVDALAHCVEAFTSKRAHPLVDGYARMGISLTGKYLARATADGTDADARAGMLLASFYGGLCLGPVNTAAGHALGYPPGTRLGLGHGLAVALLFPHVLAFNASARPNKTAEILAALGLPPATDEAEIAQALTQWCEDLGLTMSLTDHGADPDAMAAWAEEAHGIRRLMDFNPRDMSTGDALRLYRAAL
ncbi:iron-containing alcohol dehydrogenase [Amaricoccus tamworthensis]|uniref:iron-containing alcohol dehydrogenase n=1 Tax=Amaricoccus tamworthensis TaxID=57002 RepID=UPI003C7DEA23